MSERELVFSRVLNAPLSLVWQAWTNAADLANWWGPAGMVVKVATLDLKAGGTFLYSMTLPNGQVVWGKFVYEEVQPMTRLVFRSSFCDEHGTTLRNPMSAAWPLEIHNQLSLVETEGKTILTMRGNPYNATPEETKTFIDNHANVQRGLAGTFGQLEHFLDDQMVADRALFSRRTFNAPRDLVWKAWTQPHAIATWWGPSGFGNSIQTMEVKAGGKWVFTMHGPDGTDYLNLVTYNEVSPPEKLDYNHGSPGEASFFHVTVTFTERGNQTDMVYRMVFPTAAAKQESVAKYGAAEGLKQNMQRLDDFLGKSGVVLARVFAAPRSRLWDAWTNPAKIQKWWGPQYFTCPGATVDLRVGGKYLLCMRSPEGQEFWNTGTYTEIIPQEKLVYADNFADADGNILPAASLGLPGDWPEQLLVTINFAELGPEKTLVTIHQADLPADWQEMTSAGWTTSLDKLATVVA